MSAKDELGALTIRNCRVVVQSYQLTEEINDNFERFLQLAMPRILREALPGWDYHTDFLKEEFAFWNRSWVNHGEEYAYFRLVLLVNSFWINCLTGEDGEVGFAFLINPELFGDRKDKAQMLFQKFYVDNETELLKHGFQQRLGNYWYNYNFNIVHPFKLDVDAIANEYPNWSDNVLQPFRELLEDIKDTLPIFEKFVHKIADE